MSKNLGSFATARSRVIGLGSVVGLGLLCALLGVGRAYGAEPAPSVSTKVTTGHVIVVRPDRVDITVDGQIVDNARYPGGPLSIERLAQIVNRPAWLTVVGHSAVLHAGLYQAPGSSLAITAPAVRSMHLVEDAAGVGGALWGSSAALTVRGVTVTGWDPIGDEPAAQSHLRPYLYYVHGSDVSLESSTFDHLGRPVPGGRGVTFGSDTMATVSSAVFSNSSTGLSVVGAGAVTITRSTFRNNAGDGLAVKASSPVQLSNLVSSSNAGFGVHLRLTRAARLQTATTRGNANGGVSLDASQQITVTGAVSTSEHVGLQATRGCDQIVVMNSRVTGDDTGIQVRPGASRVTLLGIIATRSQLVGLDLAGSHVRVSGATLSGAPNGLTLNHRADDVMVTNSTIRSVSIGVEARPAATHVVLSGLHISQAHAVGVLSASNAIALSHLNISDAGAGVRVNGKVASATLTNSTMTRASVGVDVAASVKRFGITAVTVKQASTAINSSSPNLQVNAGTISKASIGMHLSGAAAITRENLTGVQEGFRIKGGASVHLAQVQLNASAVGFRVAPGAQVTLQDSIVSAITLSMGHIRFVGHNVLPAESLRGYGLAAVVAAVCACLLELIRKLRERADDRTWLLPSGVLNTR